MKKLIALALLAIALRAGAAVRLGPEFALSPQPYFDQVGVTIAEGEPVFATWIERANVNTSFGGAMTSQTAFDQYRGTSIAVAHGSSTFLLAWVSAELKVVARRYSSLTGLPLDATPIAIAAPQFSLPDVGAVWDGERYLVAWTDVTSRGLNARHLSEEGVVIDAPFPVIITQSPEFIVQPDVASDGHSIFFAASGYTPILVDPGPALVPTRIWFTALESAAATSPILSGDRAVQFDTSSVALAVADGRPTIVWIDEHVQDLSTSPWTFVPCIQAVQPGSEPRTLTCLRGSFLTVSSGGAVHPIDIAWSGSEYVVVWSDGEVAYAQRFDRGLDALDLNPVEVAWNVTPSSVRVVRSGDGVTIAYSRNDNGRARVFARTLVRDDAPAPQRRRGARP